MPFIKRQICEKAKTKKDTVPVDWENGERKQRLLALLPDISPQETAYGKWLITHTLERPWAELTYIERAQWAEFYFDLEKQGLRYEDDGNDEDEDEPEGALTWANWADYKVLYNEILVPEKKVKKKEQKKDQKLLSILDKNGTVIGFFDPHTDEELPEKPKHVGSALGGKQKAKKVDAGETAIQRQLKEMKASVPKQPQPQPIYNQFPSSYVLAQQSFPQEPIFPASQSTNSQFKERTMEAARRTMEDDRRTKEAARKLEKSSEARGGPYQSPYAGK
jgi:hypothetical protein